jgi:predicted GNAT family acetyltransferase
MIQSIKKDGNQFYIGMDQTSALAIISFFYDSADTIIIDHTYVSNTIRGRGIGKELVEEVATYAKEENLKVLPLCSFAKWVMTNSNDYNDILENA